eukprot:13761584-Ditylum_brightwellii.AAC.1
MGCPVFGRSLHMCGATLLGAIFAEPGFVCAIKNTAEMAQGEREAAHFCSDSGAVSGKLIYIGIKTDQRVAIEEVAQDVTNAHPSIQGCREKTNLLIKEFIDYLCRCLSWGRLRRSMWCCGGLRRLLRMRCSARLGVCLFWPGRAAPFHNLETAQ